MKDKAVVRGKGQTSGKVPPKKAPRDPGRYVEEIATTLNIGKLGKNNRKIREMTGANLKGALKRRDYNT